MAEPQKLILKHHLSPGDVLVLTAAVESLHAAHPGAYATDVRTSVPAVWQHNPHIRPLECKESRTISVRYPAVHQSNQRHVHFLHGFCEFLAEQLGVPVPLATNRPHLYLSDSERGWVNQVRQHVANGRDVPYWLVCAGVKKDYTLKQWPLENYQAVVDATRGRLQWVQIGQLNHDHPPLKGVIDLRGKTDTRQLIRLAYHAQGGLGPSTFLQHLCAAWQKPYVCLLGGREPVPWVSYPLQHTLHAIGALDCCRTKACWKSRVVPLGDGDAKDKSLCDRPVLGLERPVGRCMALITPDEVLNVLRKYC